MTTMAMTMEGVDDHNKEDPSKGGKYAGAARWAGGRLGWHRDCRKQRALEAGTERTIELDRDAM
jgi:hypothetical protein